MLSEKVFEKMIDQTEELINEHKSRIVKAFGLQDDGKLAVTITHNIAPGKAMDHFDVDTTISYTMEKVKEKISSTVSDIQCELPLAGTVVVKTKEQ